MFLADLLNILLWILGSFFFIRIIQKPQLIYYYPYIMSFGFAVFLLPQVYTIHVKEIFCVDDRNRLFLMTVLCWIMSFIGWYCYKPKDVIFKSSFLKDHNEEKLGFIAAIFIVIGIAMNFLAWQIYKTTEFKDQQGTGVVTIYYFFQHLLFLGSGLCLTLYLKNKKRFVLVFTIIGVLYCFYIGVLQGRRQQTLNALFVLGLPLYLKYNLKPSRIIIIVSLVSAFLLVPSMDQYRRLLKSSESVGEFIPKIFTEIDYIKNMKDIYVKSSESIELVNAGYEISGTYRTGAYALGIDYWNMMVFQFIPAQLLGKEFKESLKLKGSFLRDSRKHYEVMNPNYVMGSTITGVGDSFEQFDYFGSVFFLFLGMFMKRLWVTTKETGSILVQTFYSILLIECLLSITHATSFFFPGLIKAFVFLVIASWYSRT